MIRDALDPTHESEKVHESEDEEAIPSYRQLRAMLAVMDTDSHTENRDVKKDHLSPQDEEDLEETELNTILMKIGPF